MKHKKETVEKHFKLSFETVLNLFVISVTFRCANSLTRTRKRPAVQLT